MSFYPDQLQNHSLSAFLEWQSRTPSNRQGHSQHSSNGVPLVDTNQVAALEQVHLRDQPEIRSSTTFLDKMDWVPSRVRVLTVQTRLVFMPITAQNPLRRLAGTSLAVNLF